MVWGSSRGGKRFLMMRGNEQEPQG